MATSRCGCCKRDVAHEASRAGGSGSSVDGPRRLQSGAVRCLPVRIFLYSPCSLIATGRLEDVATTQRRDQDSSDDRRTHPIVCSRWGSRYTSFGHIGVFGCSIILGGRLAKRI